MRARLWAVLLLGLVAPWGCGDEAAPRQETVQGTQDTGDDAPQDTGGEEPQEDVPLDLPDEVDPNDPALDGPAAVVVTLEPAQALYRPGLRVLPKAVVLDGRGDPLEGVEVQWSVEPPEAASFQQDTGRWKLDQEGEVAFFGCLDVGSEGQRICGQKRVVSDAKGPSITLTAPTPGAWLQADQHPTIRVAGYAEDTHGELGVFVNGQAAPLDAEGRFAVDVDPRFGINHLEVVASDGLQPLETLACADVLWAPQFLAPNPARGLASLRLERGLQMRLGRRFLDDGEPLSGEVLQGEVVTQDLAGALELLLYEVDLLGRLPNPVLNSDLGVLRLNRFSPGKPEVEVRVVESGLELYLRLGDVVVGTEGELSLEGETLNLDGEIGATLSAFARIKVRKRGPAAPYEVEIEEVALALEDVEPRFLDGAANALFAFAESALRGVVERLLVEDVIGALVEQVPDVLLGAFQSLEDGISGASVDLDTGLGPAILLSLDGAVTQLLPTEGRHLQAELALEVQTNQAPRHADGGGVPLEVPVATEAPFLEAPRIQIGVPLGLLNGLLYTLWDAGLMDLDVLGVLPSEVSFLIQDAQVSPKLPPVVRRPGPGEARTDLLLALGQFELKAQLPGQEDTYGFYVEVGADVMLEEGALVLSIQPQPSLEAWVVSTTGDAPRFTPDALRALLLSQLWPRLSELVAQSLRIDLPSLSLGDLGGLAPRIGELKLVPVQEGELLQEGGYLILEGNLEGRATLR